VALALGLASIDARRVLRDDALSPIESSRLNDRMKTEARAANVVLWSSAALLAVAAVLYGVGH
jgi:hypothetical protein